MSEETTQVHPTSQEAESTQPDVEQELDPSTSEAEQLETPEEPEAKEGWELKRINQLTRQRHEAEREAQTHKDSAERYRLLVEQMQRGETTEPNAQEPQDIDALVNKRAEQLSQQKAMQERGQSVSKMGGESYPDFESAVKTLDAIGISDDQVRNLLGLDDAHKVIYHLGKNPDEAMRILALSPLQQGRELERLATKAAAAPAPNAVSKAPAPIKGIEGSRASAAPDPDKMSMAEWAKWREKTAKTRV